MGIEREEKLERQLTWKKWSTSILIRVIQITTVTRCDFTQSGWKQLEKLMQHACDERSKWELS